MPPAPQTLSPLEASSLCPPQTKYPLNGKGDAPILPIGGLGYAEVPRMRFVTARRPLGISSLLLITGCFAPAHAEDSDLRYVVILSRHGVRSPTAKPEDLNRYSAEPWPDWGVGPGMLTPHGRDLMKIV